MKNNGEILWGSHNSENIVKLTEKNKFATHLLQRCLEMCKNKQKPSVSEDFRQKSSTSDVAFSSGRAT